MYLDKYKIEGTVNIDTHPCFSSENTYPNFEKELETFKSELINMVNNKECKSFYKYGDGDYYFLKQNCTTTLNRCSVMRSTPPGDG